MGKVRSDYATIYLWKILKQLETNFPLATMKLKNNIAMFKTNLQKKFGLDEATYVFCLQTFWTNFAFCMSGPDPCLLLSTLTD